MKEIIRTIQKIDDSPDKYLIIIDPDYLKKLKGRVIEETTVKDKSALTQIAGVDVMESESLPEGKKFHILKFRDELHKNVHRSIWEG